MAKSGLGRNAAVYAWNCAIRRPEESDDKFNDRYDRWKERCEASFGMADVIIAKQRHGPIGTVKLHFEAETTKFDNFIGPERLPADDH